MEINMTKEQEITKLQEYADFNSTKLKYIKRGIDPNQQRACLRCKRELKITHFALSDNYPTIDNHVCRCCWIDNKEEAADLQRQQNQINFERIRNENRIKRLSQLSHELEEQISDKFSLKSSRNKFQKDFNIDPDSLMQCNTCNKLKAPYFFTHKFNKKTKKTVSSNICKCCEKLEKEKKNWRFKNGYLDFKK